MPDTTAHLTWQIDAADLGRHEVKTLREAVAAVAKWLQHCDAVLTAAVAVPVTVTVTAAAGDADPPVATAVGSEDPHVRLTVSAETVRSGSSDLRVALLDAALGALDAVAQRWPHEDPPTIWQSESVPNPDDADSLASMLELLPADSMILIGRLDGTPADELARFHERDEYVLDRVSRSGVAEVTDAEAGCAEVTWVLEFTEQSD